VPDGVFNHVGRGFWAFRDVLENRQSSRYCGWFNLDFGRDGPNRDGFWYEGWEGHYELVRLNLKNPEVVGHLFDCIRGWVKEFGIDGLRLDVAYLLDKEFIRALRRFTRELKSDFFLLGEVIHGDYRGLLGDGLLDSVTNYEAYKGLYSSFNTRNLFEIGYSLNRQFGPDSWTLYKGEHLLSFLDNHDVGRIASVLTNPEHLAAAYGLLFGMPGIPCVYYGGEWAAVGRKEDGDAALRPAFERPEWTALTGHIARLARLRSSIKALHSGDYRQLAQTNSQLVFSREAEGTRVIVAVNADSAPYEAAFPAVPARARELIADKPHSLSGNLPMPPYSVGYWVEDNGAASSSSPPAT
jgi:glycosidase